MGLVVFLLFSLTYSKIWFSEEFNKNWRKRWVESDAHKTDNMRGRVGWDAGTFFGNWDVQVGMKTLDNKKFYHLTADIGQNIDNRGKLLIISYTVKMEERANMTGAYIKLLSDEIDQKKFCESDPYEIMFGADYRSDVSTPLHFIMKFGNYTFQTRTMMETVHDNYTHMYTLIIKPSNTFEIRIDGKLNYTGLLRDEFDVLGPRLISDPDAVKPDDWDDRPEIDDPNAPQKPDDWDDRPLIRDENAVKPDNWDELQDELRHQEHLDWLNSRSRKPEFSGVMSPFKTDEDDPHIWKPPLIPNPNYKGKWVGRKIPNPNYKGPWVPPTIPNPNWRFANELYWTKNIRYVGFDLWQVKAGTIFDNIFIGDDIFEWEDFAKRTFYPFMEDEREFCRLLDEDAERKLKIRQHKANEEDFTRPKIEYKPVDTEHFVEYNAEEL
ncbi:putative calreticulin [Monocercomonoides exilis]|uniref:putative calreticulin n=1 Tax=Monocercomonoides exilis TaxID=2049356 RepID=UPI00355A29FA|nr:putative calreticulin [Monocercomonoides exilis]|eukprot:MONOS_10998.1-p1 / transcript=MONOS_10998.1 / gene=MONOS_10998 / organism=Monocercomonoides_exilis_PA203 / gene_product=calreticulin / transcript_product=calreticulin / location=Mono_scaffold00527:2251-3707(-) / protein_length=436 / sequence_SO=supercontig / SO=protein_coding / is_pseudo=false